MKIYGYTKICSEGGYNGKESHTVLKLSESERNSAMYDEYVYTFNVMQENESIDDTDENGDPLMGEEEFFKELAGAPNPDAAVVGLIQAADYHVQFEPFCTEL